MHTQTVIHIQSKYKSCVMQMWEQRYANLCNASELCTSKTHIHLKLQQNQTKITWNWQGKHPRLFSIRQIYATMKEGNLEQHEQKYVVSRDFKLT